MSDLFTEHDADQQLRETEALLRKTREALKAKRYVEANGYYEAAVSSLDGDIFCSLAAAELDLITRTQ